MKRYWKLAALAACAAVSSLFYNLNVTPGGYDLTLYKRMAVTGYHDQYADFPPLKMSLLKALAETNGWQYFSALLWVCLLALAVLYAWQRYRSLIAVALAVIVLAVPSIYRLAWFATWEDKAVYPVLFLALLCLLSEREPSHRRVLAIAVILGVLQAYGGPGVFLLPICALWLYRLSNARKTQITALVAVFAGVVVLSHVPYFPDWTAGYARRAARMSMDLPANSSIWCLWLDYGLPYLSAWPKLAMLGIIGTATWLYHRQRLDLHTALFLAYFPLLALGPECSFDRILAATLPGAFLLLGRPRLVIAFVALLCYIGLLDMESQADAVLWMLWTPTGLVLWSVLEPVILAAWASRRPVHQRAPAPALPLVPARRTLPLN